MTFWNFWNWLFNFAEFMPRSRCGLWTPQLIAMYQLANFLIALAYFSIPLSLLGLWFRLRTIKTLVNRNLYMVLMFSVFIMSCGLTHVGDILAFSYPMYRLFTVIDFVTAITSLLTAILLPGAIVESIQFLLKEDNAY